MTTPRRPVMYAATTNHAWLPHLDEEHRCSLLVSYAILQTPAHRTRWRDLLRTICYRSWCLDSGAFSVWNTGGTINLADFIAVSKDLWQADPTLDHVFGLDVIGDWRGTQRNTELMWAAGVPALPTYHVGEPEDVLIGYARDYPKIALGGMVPLKGQVKQRFAEQCFARIWPCAVHGLGVGTRDLALAVPWHSVDASSLEAGPFKYGMWKSYGRTHRLGVRAWSDIRPEVAWFLNMERTVQQRWAREMTEVDARLRAAGWKGYTHDGESTP